QKPGDGRSRSSGAGIAYRVARVVHALARIVERSDGGGIGHLPGRLGQGAGRVDVVGEFRLQILGQIRAGGVHAAFDLIGGIVECGDRGVTFGVVVGRVAVVGVDELVVLGDAGAGGAGEQAAVVGDGLVAGGRDLRGRGGSGRRGGETAVGGGFGGVGCRDAFDLVRATRQGRAGDQCRRGANQPESARVQPLHRPPTPRLPLRSPACRTVLDGRLT